MSPADVLELRGFGVGFGARRVLRSVSMAVPGPGCTVLLGPSGTGKSTLLRTLAGYNASTPQLRTWGQAWYAGGAWGAYRRPALVMQNSRLLVSNLLENLVCDLPGRAALTRLQQIDLLAPLLHECGQEALLERLGAKVVERPLAEQRAIAILRQAVAAPQLLMIDEPTAGLAAAEAEPLLRLVGTLARRHAVLVVLHNLQQACRLADQVVLIADGVVQEAGCASAFFASPRTTSGRQFLATGSCPEVSAVEAVEDVPLRPPPPPPPPVVPSAARGPRGFVWLIPGSLAGTPWPGVIHDPSYDLRALREVGVTRLVTLTEESFDQSLARAHGIECLWSPMPDMHPPGIAQARGLCAAIHALLEQGEGVAVHCHAGLGRTGTVLAAYWLWRHRGAIGAVQALEEVRRREPGWVQSQAQVDFLEDFEQVVRYDRIAAPDAVAPIP